MAQVAYIDEPVAHAPATIRPEFAGRIGELAPIVARNVALTLLTLGVYRFWARTRVRRYLWSRTSLLGDPFEYTGTGGELFRGFLIVLFLVLLPLAAYNFAVDLLIDPDRWELRLAAVAPLYATILFLVGVATHRARRYRFSRTVWRGVRFAQAGSSVRYGLQYLAFFVLDLVTLGWSYPWTNLRLAGALVNDTWFGDRRFAFAGPAKPLYERYVAVWLVGLIGALLIAGLAIATLRHWPFALMPDDVKALTFWVGVAALLAMAALVWLMLTWYQARQAAYFAACTRYEGLQARFEVSAGALLGLAVSNLLIWLATLGLGGAFLELRNLRFVCARLSFAGEVDAAAIGQNRASRPGRGEGLAEAFDVGAV